MLSFHICPTIFFIIIVAVNIFQLQNSIIVTSWNIIHPSSSNNIHRLQQQHGPELARLSQCVLQLKDCLDFIKAASFDVTEVQGLMQLARDRLERARKDNDTIYLDDVPAVSALPEIRSQILVKSNLPLPPAMLQPKVSLFQWEKSIIKKN